MKYVLILSLLFIPYLLNAESIKYYSSFKWDEDNNKPVVSEMLSHKTVAPYYYYVNTSDKSLISKVIFQNAYNKSIEEHVFYYNDRNQITEYIFRIAKQSSFCNEPIFENEEQIPTPKKISEFIITGNRKFTYDENSLLVQQITSTTDEKELSSCTINYTYNDFRKLAEKEISITTKGSSSNSKVRYEYSKHGLLLAEYHFNFDDVLTNYISYDKRVGSKIHTTKHYDGNDNLTDIYKKEFDEDKNLIEDSHYNNKKEIIYSHRLRYDKDNLLLEEQFTFNATSSKNIPYLYELEGKHFVYKYNDGKLVKIQVFDANNNNISYEVKYEYSKNDVSKVILYNSNKEYLNILYYNNIGKITDDIKYNADGTFKYYVNFDYDEYGNIISIIEKDPSKKIIKEIKKTYDSTGLITKYQLQSFTKGPSYTYLYEYFVNKEVALKITRQKATGKKKKLTKTYSYDGDLIKH